jgi:hypothetical protein
MSVDDENNLLAKSLAFHERALPFLVLMRLEPKAAIAEALVTAVVEVWARRAELFKSELIALNIDPSEERLRKGEHLEGLLATAKRVQEATNERKIRDFAAMFATYYGGGHFHSIDHFDEYLSILDELSAREIQVLLILHKHELASPLNGRNHLQRANAIWNAFALEVRDKVGIEPEHIPAILTRIQRTGLYETITGAFLNYGGGRGYLTALFADFIVTLKIAPVSPSDSKP